MLWLTKWMITGLMMRASIQYEPVYGSESTYTARNLNDNTLKKLGSLLIQRSWVQVVKDDEHVYTKGKYEIVVNFELDYVCVYKITPPKANISMNLG